jgi:hypothetical protein
MIQTFSGHYEIREHWIGRWYHLRTYEARGVPVVIVASACPHGGDDRLEGVGYLATRVFWHLLPYARADYRWFEERHSDAVEGRGKEYNRATITCYDSSGGPRLSNAVRKAVDRRMMAWPSSRYRRIGEGHRLRVVHHEHGVVHGVSAVACARCTWGLPPP